jgi:D-alanyl-D-alanine dipeptidase
MILKSVMERNGFKNLKEEWWHYTLVNEPYPDEYFDFEVE